MLALRTELHNCLTENILPYWLRLRDPNGGFYGATDAATDQPDTEAERGAILNARILWTFSAAYRVVGDKTYRDAADHAYHYFTDHFLDYDFGGVYWSVSAEGEVANDRKQFYALAFAVYGLSEYYRITQLDEAREYAIALYRDIERYAWDAQHGGYIEALARDWSPLEDMRLSIKDVNAPKSQNTHLHLLEAYTNLYRIWPDATLRVRIMALIDLFRTRLVDAETGHVDLFFGMDWQPVEPRRMSYGHEIETSWLLDEAAQIIDYPQDDLVLRLASVADEGLQPDGSMIHENVDPHREWWVECEAIVGYTNIGMRFGDEQALAKAKRLWKYTHTHLIDHEHGEWYWDCDNEGRPNLTEPKAGFWKCPYHNGRMCLEIIERL